VPNKFEGTDPGAGGAAQEAKRRFPGLFSQHLCVLYYFSQTEPSRADKHRVSFRTVLHHVFFTKRLHVLINPDLLTFPRFAGADH
jgi:hypothetical protein